MDIGLLLPFIILIGAMLLMTRSAKKKQQQAAQMRDRMEPGTGIRTIGGMYALVKEVHSDTVLLEVAPGVHAVYAKNAVGAVLEADEYERIVNGEDHDADAPVVPDDASSLVSDGGVDKTDLSKTDSSADDAETGDAKRKGDTDSK
ncbi:preprotein translocase subunit YajC [Streptomyces pini]|uniref:Preprotein translocase subunit YajC n=1 Tax=Streptomyces pini TaxID=1520580 RepID=A0A1I4F0B9_9ACTN|nr:preprotein translocase subunit YajC [Streptomyces pini]SFL11009.1 preprotein translocase subunit YajC [Streptomyces pini]